ncbi:hypothetical protein LUZ61_017160 [Rhynchospora tenuis]|uniref:Uncharacterized protein n=1 Tax=Rhynchospora tenuis TaxID=198213 RepID=A0AAD5Z6W0_9POAL|nr:hypothetical protein LUZ61_017160 [Rhynchospora tenuis]
MALPNHLTSEIRTDDPLALSIKKKLESSVTFQSRTTERPINIFRVPYHIRERHKNFYEPRLVSIGPYHRGSERLKCMEEQKLQYVRKMLDDNPDVTLNHYLEVLKKLEPAARRCYYEKIYMDSGEFIEMLLFDACFIIQLAVNWSFPVDDQDIVYDISWNIPLIKTDLLMLENQIPFFVLQNVFDLYSGKVVPSDLISPSSTDPMSPDSELDNVSLSEDSDPDRASLFDVLADFLQSGSETLTLPEPDNNYDHLLDFYYQCYMRTQKYTMKWREVSPIISSIRRRLKMIMRRRLKMVMRKPRMIPCATMLQEAGITFKKADSKSIFNVHFSNGVLRIPYIVIEEAKRPLIMNLIAFEQCTGQRDKPLTSYAVFMDCIVNKTTDVLILEQNQIIENKMADEKAAAEFFDQLRYCAYLDYEEHHLAEVFVNVREYCDSGWQKYRVKLHRGYRSADLFKNPWTIISFLAAVVLLILAFLQTLYGIMSYYQGSSH